MTKTLVGLMGLLLVLLAPVAAQDSTLPELEVITAENAGQVEQIATLDYYTDWVLDVQFSPDGRLLAVGDRGDIRLWDTRTLEQIAILLPESEEGYFASSLAFSADGTILASALNFEVWLWNTQKATQLGQVRTDQTSGVQPIPCDSSEVIRSIAFSPDSEFIASGSEAGTIEICNIGTGETVATLLLHDSHLTVTDLAFSPDGSMLLTGSTDGMAILWNVNTGEEEFSSSCSGAIWNVAFSPDGTLFSLFNDVLSISGDEADSSIQLWNANMPTEHSNSLTCREVTGVAFSPDGSLFVAGGSRGSTSLWNTETGELLAPLPVGAISSIAFSPDQKLLAIGRAGSVNEFVQLWGVPIEPE